MNFFKRIKYAFSLSFGNTEHLSLQVKHINGRIMLDVMARIEDNDTLLLMTPYLQGLIDQSMGLENWDVN